LGHNQIVLWVVGVAEVAEVVDEDEDEVER